MAEHEEIRLVVKVKPGRHPELYEHLKEIEKEGRTERIRMLAAMALMGGSIEGKSEPSSGKSAEHHDEKKKPQERVAQSQTPKAAETGEPEDKATQDPYSEQRRSFASSIKDQF